MAKPCKGCGKPVVFAKDKETGRWQVLSNTVPVWRQIGSQNGVPMVMRDNGALVSHFINCPNADQFSSSKKETEPEQQHFSEPKEVL